MGNLTLESVEMSAEQQSFKYNSVNTQKQVEKGEQLSLLLRFSIEEAVSSNKQAQKGK